jgi:hypothetical protein
MLIYYMYRLFLTKLSNFADIQKFIKSVFKVYSNETYYRVTDENYCGVANKNHYGVTVEAITALFLLFTVLALYTLE